MDTVSAALHRIQQNHSNFRQLLNLKYFAILGSTRGISTFDTWLFRLSELSAHLIGIRMISSFCDECVQWRSMFNILNTITITISFYGTNAYIIWQLICLLCTSFFLTHISNVKKTITSISNLCGKWKRNIFDLLEEKQWYSSRFGWFHSWWRIVTYTHWYE